MCIFAIFLRRYLVKTVVKSKRRYLLNGSCDFFLVFTKRSSGGSSFWWTPWFMVEIFFGNNTSLVRCAFSIYRLQVRLRKLKSNSESNLLDRDVPWDIVAINSKSTQGDTLHSHPARLLRAIKK